MYMTPTLKAGVLAAHLTGEDGKVVTEGASPEQNQVPFELQNIFANLQESEKQYFKPTEFINSFKWDDSQLRRACSRTPTSSSTS